MYQILIIGQVFITQRKSDQLIEILFSDAGVRIVPYFISLSNEPLESKKSVYIVCLNITMHCKKNTTSKDQVRFLMHYEKLLFFFFL